MWQDRYGDEFTGGSKLQPVVPRDLAKEPALFPSSTCCSSTESFLLPRNLGFCKDPFISHYLIKQLWEHEDAPH